MWSRERHQGTSFVCNSPWFMSLVLRLRGVFCWTGLRTLCCNNGVCLQEYSGLALLCAFWLSMIDCTRNFETCMVMMSDVDIEPILDRYMLLADNFLQIWHSMHRLLVLVDCLVWLFHLLSSFFIFVVPLYCFWIDCWLLFGFVFEVLFDCFLNLFLLYFECFYRLLCCSLLLLLL